MAPFSKFKKTSTQSLSCDSTPHLNSQRHLIGVQKFYSKQEMESSARYLFAINRGHGRSRFLSDQGRDQNTLTIKK